MRLRSSGPADADASLESKPVVVTTEVEPLRPSRRRVKATEVVGVKREQVKKVEEGPPTPKKRTRKDRKAKKREEPKGWQEILRGIEEMRANKDAEVDKYGCEVSCWWVKYCSGASGSLECVVIGRYSSTRAMHRKYAASTC
ncbi:unnamed protein product [Phytophthora fragariaefolia]|uniref:Unnamed protein product n=1 Tax=Phytophthora fragariaefolia TaxID=1490495 RepID=A0A9W6YKW8_9STRA|nr:unnamed protein product [Phytophthora fragariaefolia]